MASIPGFKHDIFVSYARVDDVPVVQECGWVSTLVGRIKALLAMRLGQAHAYSIWMDKYLTGNEPFPDMLIENIRQSALLIIIMSPAYLQSEWCRKESNAFLENLKKDPHHDGRVFIVEMTPTQRAHWPAELRDLVASRFWQDEDGLPVTLGFPSIEQHQQEYLKALNVLVAHLARKLHDLAQDLARLPVDLVDPRPRPEAAEEISNEVSSASPKILIETAAWLEGKRDSGEYDVFLCHNSEDKPAVKQVGELLISQRIAPWLDEWDLRPGLPWQETLEAQINQIKSAAVFVGASGFGPWQNMELAAFIRVFFTRRCPVIPIVLSSCEKEPQLPPFLSGFTWVDFRRSEPEPMRQLIWGITGLRPTMRAKGHVS
jgi:TIR domain-containing protein